MVIKCAIQRLVFSLLILFPLHSNSASNNLLNQDNVIDLQASVQYTKLLNQACGKYLQGRVEHQCNNTCGQMDKALLGISHQLGQVPVNKKATKKAFNLFANRLKQCISSWPNKKNLPMNLKPFLDFVKTVQSGVTPISAPNHQAKKLEPAPENVTLAKSNQPSAPEKPVYELKTVSEDTITANKMCGTWELEEHLLNGHMYAESFLKGCTPHFYGHEQFIIAGIANGITTKCHIKLPKEMMLPVTTFVNKLIALKNTNKPVDRGLPSAQLNSQKRAQYFSSGERRVNSPDECAEKGKKYLTRVYETLKVYPEEPDNKICGVYGFDQYPNLINDIRDGCSRQLEGLELLFLAGATDAVLSNCNLKLPINVKSSMVSFVATQIIVRDGTMPQSANKVKLLKDQGQRTTHYAFGAKAARKNLVCTEVGKEFVIRLNNLLGQETSHPNQPSFVSECVDYYQGEHGFNNRKCSCVADIFRGQYPDIHTRHFDPLLFKQLAKQNPILGMQMIGQCGLNQY